MDAITALGRALGNTGRIIAAIKPDQWADPTPCTEYDVRAVVGHLISANFMFAQTAVAKKFGPAQGTGPDPSGDPVGVYEQSAKVVSDAWQSTGALEGTLELPFGTFPAMVAFGINLGEVLVHGWDIAKATGQDPGVDDELATFAAANLPPMPDHFRGPVGSGMPFGPAADAPAGAGPMDRIVAQYGRTP